MSMLTLAIITITMALLLYTIGVWSERLSRQLSAWQLFFFFGGLVFDTVGTEYMRQLAGGGMRFGLHSMTGLAALLIMGIHAVWAAVTILRGDSTALKSFHRFSTTVWVFWLIPFITGAALNSGMI
ncbi:MAG: HsmA family protein [Caldilineaceae bacterium]